MSRTATIILLGILILLTPFSGLPLNFRTFLQVIFGAFVLGIGLLMRAQEARSMHVPSEPPASAPESPSSVSPI